MKKTMMALALVSCFALTACWGEAEADADVKGALSAQYDRPLCEIFVPQPPFTIFTQSITGGDKHAAAAEVLAKAGVLVKTEEKTLSPGNVTATFGATEKGAELFQGKRICYGNSKLVKILEVSETQNANGLQVRSAKVLVSYEITEDWAKDPALQHLVKTGEHEFTEALIKNGDAWVMPQ